MGKPKLKQTRWYNFDHKYVSKRFEGGLTFCVYGEYYPTAVYKVKTPNKAKGHKKYMLLNSAEVGSFIRGMSAKEMAKYRYQEAVHCLTCNLILYSINRHHYNVCDCGEEQVSIDGGKDYTKIGYNENSKYKMVTLDLLTGKIKK